MSEKVLDVEDFMERVQGDKELLFELLDILYSSRLISRNASTYVFRVQAHKYS